MSAALWILALVVAWNLIPLVVLWRLPLEPRVKAQASRDLLRAAWRGLLTLPADLLAPLVVPLALVFTPREAEHLPRLFAWWDNDVSINGDHAEGEPTYYARWFDRRSFIARWVWLGWRNRASRLSQQLGHRWAPGEYQDARHWGDPSTGRNHQGWTLNRRGPRWQLYLVKRLSFGLCFRLNYGFKVWAFGGDRRPVASLVNISASVLRWRGQ